MRDSRAFDGVLAFDEAHDEWAAVVPQAEVFRLLNKITRVYHPKPGKSFWTRREPSSREPGSLL